MQRKKNSKFVPYDRVQEGVEVEELIDEDHRTKITRILHRRENLKMFLLERRIENEKEYLEFVHQIQSYEVLNAEGLV